MNLSSDQLERLKSTPDFTPEQTLLLTALVQRIAKESMDAGILAAVEMMRAAPGLPTTECADMIESTVKVEQ